MWVGAVTPLRGGRSREAPRLADSQLRPAPSPPAQPAGTPAPSSPHRFYPVGSTHDAAIWFTVVRLFGEGRYLMPSFGISKRIFPAAISSRATVTGLPESTSTIGNAPSFNCRARLAATITSAYLFSTRSSSASRGGLITCRHPRWESGRSLRTTPYCINRRGVKQGASASALSSLRLRGGLQPVADARE